MGRSDFWSKVFNKKTSKSLKTTAKRVKTQLEWAIPGLRVVNAVNTVWKATEVAGNVSSAAQTVNEAIPEVVLAGKSIASSASKAAYAAAFTSVISTVGTFGGLAIAYQGTQALNRIARDLNNISRSTVAHIGLTAPREFAQNVCDFINEKMHMHPDKGRTEHAFFVYHPDTDWTSPFADILWNGGLHDREGRYRGRTSNLDFATIMMLQTLEREEEPGKKLKLHLIIPAYRLLLIEEPIRLPEALGELRIHGKIHDSTEWGRKTAARDDLVRDLPPQTQTMRDMHPTGPRSAAVTALVKMTETDMHETQGDGVIMDMKEATDRTLQALGTGDEKTTGPDLREADETTEGIGYNVANNPKMRDRNVFSSDGGIFVH
ncbi:hypothetical protein J7T55_002557 [Diaporthe amygdali]|uniref:uncharacterized protein n=1 Tax=Phomopsis amygdali TaxID=1214568 RepID=UPI0022FE6915|nr:uncharacterized protein J7T55_002557 [Diaporthe amygdali]KAJ0122046.1 hypothetical protein J7T55_002557 [Diaporthe amygdali]